VFGREPRPLQYMDRLNHSLAEDEVDDLEPRLAVAVGLALGGLGGPKGFNFRQEELAFTRRFDRIKLPLAIACMLGLFFACFWGLKLYKDVDLLEGVYGKEVIRKKKAKSGRKTARGRKRAASGKQVYFSGYLGTMVNPTLAAQRLLEPADYAKLMKSLANADPFDRIARYLSFMEAERRDLKPSRLEDIEVVGANIADVRVADFKRPQTSAGDLGLGRMPWYQRILEPLFKDAFTVRPRVIYHRCIACGTCIKGCPMEAVSFVDERAFIDDDKCIRCYCCHEMCPEEAIGLHRSWLYQLVKPV